MITHVSRFYAPRQLPESDWRPFALFSIRLAADSFDQPLCLTAIGKFPRDVDANVIWDRWTDSKPVMSFLDTNAGTQVLGQELRKDFMPDAKHVEAFLTPVTDLCDEQALKLTDRSARYGHLLRMAKRRSWGSNKRMIRRRGRNPLHSGSPS